jgi:hypothetical protein
MFETVVTNGAAIITIMVLWSTLTWVVTYVYMSEKIRRKNETIECLDEYIDQDQILIDKLRESNDLMKGDLQYYLGCIFDLEEELTVYIQKFGLIREEG